MKFKLSKYIFPSVISMVILGTYTNIDGFFIGNAAGDNGLAAINIVWPFVAFIMSLGTGIGIGGSVMVNKLRGSGRENEAESAKKATVLTLFAAGIVLSLILFPLYSPLLKLMGADGQVLEYSENYSFVICLFAVIQVVSGGIVVILRNDGKTYLSMILGAVGLVIHLVLDILLVKKYTLYGVAVSTVVAQAAVMIIGLIAVKYKKGTKFNKKYMPEILKRAIAPFGVNFVSSLVLLFTNYFAMVKGGPAAVAAYAVMSYAVYTFDYIFQGVCDGVQPAISFCCASGDDSERHHAMRVSGITIGITALCCIALTPILIKIMPILFNVSPEANKIMVTGFMIYAFSYPFKATVKYICSYYYACGEMLVSSVLTFLDPLFLTPLLLIVLPKFFGINGIWLAMTLTQIILSVIGLVTAFVLNRKKKKLLN